MRSKGREEGHHSLTLFCYIFFLPPREGCFFSVEMLSLEEKKILKILVVQSLFSPPPHPTPSLLLHIPVLYSHSLSCCCLGSSFSSSSSSSSSSRSSSSSLSSISLLAAGIWLALDCSSTCLARSSCSSRASSSC